VQRRKRQLLLLLLLLLPLLLKQLLLLLLLKQLLLQHLPLKLPLLQRLLPKPPSSNLVVSKDTLVLFDQKMGELHGSPIFFVATSANDWWMGLLPNANNSAV
jgi:hypothetical protein